MEVWNLCFSAFSLLPFRPFAENQQVICSNWSVRRVEEVCSEGFVNQFYIVAKPFWREVVSFANNISSLIVAGNKIEFGETSCCTPLKPSLPHNLITQQSSVLQIYTQRMDRPLLFVMETLTRRDDRIVCDTSPKRETSVIIANNYCVW